MGFRGQVSRNTLAHANEVRDWRTYRDFAQVTIGVARDGEQLGNNYARIPRKTVVHDRRKRDGASEVDPRPAEAAGGPYLLHEVVNVCRPFHSRVRLDRLVLPDAVTLPMAVKVIAAPKYKVSPDGRIMGKGHAKRDAVGWMFPPLWPANAATPLRRTPYPALKGHEERILLRAMEDALIPAPADTVAYYTPTVPAHRNQVHVGGDVVLVRKDGTAVTVVDYWYETPEAVSFVLKGHRFGTIPMSELDLSETFRINKERGVEFRVAAAN